MNMTRVAIASLLSGIVIFFWGFVSHAVLTLGETGIRNLPSEQVLVPQLKQGISEPGFYRFPGGDMNDKSETAQNEWNERIKRGPTGMLIIRPGGRELNMGKLLSAEFFTNLLSGLLLTFVLARVKGGKLTRTIFGAAMGLFAWLAIDASYWNWYDFPADYAMAQCIEQTVSGLLAGLTIALVLGKGQTETVASIT